MKKLLAIALLFVTVIGMTQSPQLEPDWWQPNGTVNAIVKDSRGITPLPYYPQLSLLDRR